MPEIDYTRNEPIALITLNRPAVHNAVNFTMKKLLSEAWRDFRDDPALWVCIITGSGEKSFCSGLDIECLKEQRESRNAWQVFEDATWKPDFMGINRNFSIWKPKIAAINGYCLGGGLELALACDIRIASRNATFGLPEIGLGMIPGGGGTQRLPRLISPGKALEMIITGSRIGAEEALNNNLIHMVVDQSQLLKSAFEIARRICSNAPLAVRAALYAIYRGLDLSLEDGLRLETMLSGLLQHTNDAKEGIQAFKDKRKAKFTGT